MAPTISDNNFKAATEILKPNKTKTTRVSKQDKGSTKAPAKRGRKKAEKRCMIVETPVEVMDLVMKGLTEGPDYDAMLNGCAWRLSNYKEILKEDRKKHSNYDHLSKAAGTERNPDNMFKAKVVFQSKGGWAARADFSHECPSDIVNLAMTCGSVWSYVQMVAPFKISPVFDITASSAYVKAKSESAQLPKPLRNNVDHLDVTLHAGRNELSKVFQKFFAGMKMGKDLKSLTFRLHGIPWYYEDILPDEARWVEVDEFLKAWSRLECPFRVKIVFPTLKFHRTIQRVSIWMELEEMRLERLLGDIPKSKTNHLALAGLKRIEKGSLKIENYMLSDNAEQTTEDDPKH
ncbi:hypothetical protein BDZ85DRAFT_303496 [Elsinoe ampelina]|uniref:Uncharacterized protein n=1 Tax=Elsinoe ampelina TaxID=302913 RepID=A0A6A6G474_9PEZI|nr:hypothetical protein BDZ85DRAFT_303496 [Elsinoe ampelina]